MSWVSVHTKQKISRSILLSLLGSYSVESSPNTKIKTVYQRCWVECSYSIYPTGSKWTNRCIKEVLEQYSRLKWLNLKTIKPLEEEWSFLAFLLQNEQANLLDPVRSSAVVNCPRDDRTLQSCGAQVGLPESGVKDVSIASFILGDRVFSTILSYKTKQTVNTFGDTMWSYLLIDQS